MSLNASFIFSFVLSKRVMGGYRNMRAVLPVAVLCVAKRFIFW